LAEGPQTDDVNFQRFKLVDTHNFFVVNSYINLFARVMGKKVQSKMPAEISYSGTPDFNSAIEEIEALTIETCRLMDELNFAEAVACIKKIVFAGNNVLASNEFWTLCNGNADQLRRL